MCSGAPASKAATARGQGGARQQGRRARARARAVAWGLVAVDALASDESNVPYGEPVYFWKSSACGRGNAGLLSLRAGSVGLVPLRVLSVMKEPTGTMRVNVLPVMAMGAISLKRTGSATS